VNFFPPARSPLSGSSLQETIRFSFDAFCFCFLFPSAISRRLSFCLFGWDERPLYGAWPPLFNPPPTFPTGFLRRHFSFGSRDPLSSTKVNGLPLISFSLRPFPTRIPLLIRLFLASRGSRPCCPLGIFWSMSSLFVGAYSSFASTCSVF